jgi:hypothetical protein
MFERVRANSERWLDLLSNTAPVRRLTLRIDFIEVKIRAYFYESDIYTLVPLVSQLLLFLLQLPATTYFRRKSLLHLPYLYILTLTAHPLPIPQYPSEIPQLPKSGEKHHGCERSPQLPTTTKYDTVII